MGNALRPRKFRAAPAHSKAVLQGEGLSTLIGMRSLAGKCVYNTVIQLEFPLINSHTYRYGGKTLAYRKNELRCIGNPAMLSDLFAVLHDYHPFGFQPLFLNGLYIRLYIHIFLLESGATAAYVQGYKRYN
jgi:hypothetical protein